MKKIFKTSIALAVAGLLTACGGGDNAASIANDLVKISFNAPSGKLEAGQLITITGTASSSSGKLSSMNWSVSNAGATNSVPTLTNDTCAVAQKTDSSFGKGSSIWNCTLSFLVPKNVAANTTYDVNLSASTGTYSSSEKTSFTVKPATIQPNPIQVSFAPLASTNRAGEMIRVTGTVSSNSSKLTGARWSLIGGGNVNTTATTQNLTPALTNADCADKVQSDNVSGVESSLLTCTLGFYVPSKMPAATNYTLALVGTNADGYSLSNSITLPVQLAAQVTNKVAIAMGAAPATMYGGDKLALRANATSTASKLDLTTANWLVISANPVQPLTGLGLTVSDIVAQAQNGMMNGGMVSPTAVPSACVVSNNPSGAGSSSANCTTEFTAPLLPVDVTYTLGFTIADDEGYSNTGTVDVKATARTDVFGLRADVTASPSSIVAPGTNVTLTCQGAGATSGAYSYLWRVKTSSGLLIPLNTQNIANGVVTFTAPSVTADTSIELECVVSANYLKAVTSVPITIDAP